MIYGKKLLIFVGFTIVGLLPSCSCSNKEYGTFYSLNEIYSNKYITKNDLINISYYNNNCKIYDKDYNILDSSIYNILKFDPLEDNITFKICNDYKILFENMYTKTELENDKYEISIYCGKYGDYYAVRMSEVLSVSCVTGFESIDDVWFEYPYVNGNKVILWKENS